MSMYLGSQKVDPALRIFTNINNQNKTITENGTYAADEGYTGLGEVVVDVREVNNQNKTITENGIYTADEGYTGLGEVVVNVPGDAVIESLPIIPVTTPLHIEAPLGTDGFSPINVEAVTSSIDGNIKAENIKNGVTILGVTGTFGDNVPSGTLNINTDGVYNVADYAIANISVEKTVGFLVQVVDYDGTVLKSERLSTGSTFTLPNSPTHTGLVFDGWSSPVPITNNTITVTNSDIIIGAMYNTASGLSEFDIEVNSITGFTLDFNMNGTKDWGDGTSDTSNGHTYTNPGRYTITCDGVTIGATSSIINSMFGVNGRKMVLGVRLSKRVINGFTNNGSSFHGCDSMEYMTLPKGIARIGNECFHSCYSLRNLVIPDTVMSLGDRAFYGCRSLKNIVLPSSITEMGVTVLGGCPCLEFVTIPYAITRIKETAFSGCQNLQSVSIPNSVTSIETMAFSRCYTLQSVSIPNSVTSIGDLAFYDCMSLQTIVIPDSVTSIGERAFMDCRNLQSITIPNSVISIGGDTFNNCQNLKKIEIPTGTTVDFSGSYGFARNCESLQTIVIPDSVTSIGYGTFGGCYTLQSITIPNSVTSIGAYAFSYCYSLESISIPNSVTSIGDSAFTTCSAMKEYDFTTFTSIPTLSNTNAFDQIKPTCKIKVPAAIEAQWKAATNWATYADYIVGV